MGFCSLNYKKFHLFIIGNLENNDKYYRKVYKFEVLSMKFKLTSLQTRLITMF